VNKNNVSNLDPAKQNPFVHLEFCDARHTQVNTKLDEILWVLKGDPKNTKDGGIIGEMRDQRRDRKWIYAILTMIGIPIIFLLIEFFLKGGA